METPIYTLQDRAIEKAKAELTSKGITDPLLRGLLKSAEEFDESIRYSEKLAQLTAHYIKYPNGERPIIPLSCTATSERKPYKDD
jgi:hypothetical protein